MQETISDTFTLAYPFKNKSSDHPILSKVPSAQFGKLEIRVVCVLPRAFLDMLSGAISYFPYLFLVS